MTRGGLCERLAQTHERLGLVGHLAREQRHVPHDLRQHMNRAPGRLDFVGNADLGDGFLMRRGFTLVWIGWQFDLPRNGRLLGADLPRAAGTSGVVSADFTPNDSSPTFVVADLAGYSPADPTGGDAVLTVRDVPFGPETVVDRDWFELRGNVLTMDRGFDRGGHVRKRSLSWEGKTRRAADV